MGDSGSRTPASTTRRNRGIAPYRQWRGISPTDKNQRPRWYAHLSHQEPTLRAGKVGAVLPTANGSARDQQSTRTMRSRLLCSSIVYTFLIIKMSGRGRKMCNRAQSSPRIWAMAMGSTSEHICFCPGEAWSASPFRASTPSLGLSCSQLKLLRGPGAPQALRPGGQVI